MQAKERKEKREKEREKERTRGDVAVGDINGKIGKVGGEKKEDEEG